MSERIRILSDIHYGDRASRVRRLAQIRPLLDGVEQLVLNGDTLDTRPGPRPVHTAECRADVLEFFAEGVSAVTYLTGNHDADFSPHHRLDLAGGDVFVHHGDALFETIAPWGRDVPLIKRLMAEELRKLPPTVHHDLEQKLALVRRVAAAIPQRHQSERHPLKYLLRFAADTVWPPFRVVHVLRAWQTLPKRASDFVRRHRPEAKFTLVGHTHRPGIWQRAGGVIVINTGAFCFPFGSYAVDLADGKLTVRAIHARNGEFHLGERVREFPLARA